LASVEPDLHELVKSKLVYTPIITGKGDRRITELLIDNELQINTSVDKIMLCGNLEFNHQVTEWCITQGMKEGSLREPGNFVIERAFVEK